MSNHRSSEQDPLGEKLAPWEIREKLGECKDPWEYLRLYKQLPPDDRDPLPVGASCARCGSPTNPWTVKRIGPLLYERQLCASGHLVHHAIVDLER